MSPPLLLEGTSRAIAFDAGREWLERVGIPGLASRIPAELSGGERQRAAAARALVHDPVVVFADEPTGALDSLAAERLLELLAGVAESSDLTMLIVTDDPRGRHMGSARSSSETGGPHPHLLTSLPRAEIA